MYKFVKFNNKTSSKRFIIPKRALLDFHYQTLKCDTIIVKHRVYFVYILCNRSIFVLPTFNLTNIS